MEIFKYHLEIADTCKTKMPMGAEVLHVAEQNGELCVWALVNPENTLQEQLFRIFGTGHRIPDDEYFLKHVGTVLMENGKLVWHVFQYKIS